MPLANSAAENTLATLGAVCWSIQLIPQIWKSWRRKDTAGLSTLMLFVWFVSGVFLGSYCVTSNLSIPLIVQPQAFCFFGCIAWSQCLHYDKGWSRTRATCVALLSLALGGGIEAALIEGCKALQRRGNEHMNFALGVLAAIFVGGGLLPQYWEVWRYKAVIGISLVFLFVDLCGGVFSVLSLIFATGSFDVLASISYSAVVVLELGIFLLAAILNPRYRRKQRQKAERAEREREEGETTVLEEGEGEGNARGEVGRTPKAVDGEDGTGTDEEAAREGGFGWLGEHHPHQQHHAHRQDNSRDHSEEEV
ncbi:hypothetical protein JCM21900_000270 [Sporobolomyces salmonicolor]